MKRCLHIVSFLFGLAMLVACSKPTKVEVPELVEGPTKELATIDSLMWQRPDSALAVMMEFAGSEAADSLGEFEGHYCQVLIAELLFKNDYVQSNRKDLLKAVAYFDSLTFTLNDIPHASRRHCGLDPQSPNQNDNIVFLSARAHYMNGVGFYEQGDLANACTEYLNTLRIMESHFSEKELVDKKARFMALTYGRLIDMFKGQLMPESAIYCAKQYLLYNQIAPTSLNAKANILYQIGLQYHILQKPDSVVFYYDADIQPLATFIIMPDNSILPRYI